MSGRALDRSTLVAIGAGLALMLQPFWDGGLRVGFFVTFAAVVAQIVVSHLVDATASAAADEKGR